MTDSVQPVRDDSIKDQDMDTDMIVLDLIAMVSTVLCSLESYVIKFFLRSTVGMV